MLYRRRVIPPELERRWGLTPRLAEALARKESLECARCGAKLRTRRLARVLLDRHPIGSPPAPARSVREWASHPEARSLRIAEINRVEGLHDALAGLPGLAYSEYREGAAPGSSVGGIRCEDLTALSYPDASFDLVLTSETLEHVPDLAAALGEIRRVLRPGGRHLFTVPMLPEVPRTFPRASIRPDGTVEHHATPIAHPGGDAGYPVFTEFGSDLPDLLRDAGFRVETVYGPTREDDLAQVYACEKL
jgi:SAM-dependent methyltransferase